MSYECLPYEFYCNMPVLFGHLLSSGYTLCQQNVKHPQSCDTGVVTLIKKTLDKKDEIRNLRSITLLKIVAKVLAKRMARVVCVCVCRGLLVREALLMLSRADLCRIIATLYATP